MLPGMNKPLLLQSASQLADHLRAFRRTRGLTQTQLGQLVGLDQTRIAKIEHDPSRVNVGTLLQLLAALKVRVLLQPLDKSAAAPERQSDW
jgi:transcriptional regulator with XRE-family HTH domain